MLYLSYNSHEIQDGLGAQLHRIFAIYAIAKSNNLGYIHEPIAKLLEHPLDNSTIIDLELINELFSFESDIDSSKLDANSRIIYIQNLDLTTLKYYKNMAECESIILKITNPFKCINLSPDNYLVIRNQTIFSKQNHKKSGQKIIVIHFRQGIRKTKSLQNPLDDRYLDLEYFEKVIKRIKNISDYQIKILTDLPLGNTYFSIKKDDKVYWDRFGYNVNDHHILQYEGIEIESSTIGKLTNAEIIREGGPMVALEYMTSADILIMSKSSLSFISALLNTSGTIVYPPNFSARKLKHWKRSDSFNLPKFKKVIIIIMHYFRTFFSMLKIKLSI